MSSCGKSLVVYPVTSALVKKMVCGFLVPIAVVMYVAAIAELIVYHAEIAIERQTSKSLGGNCFQSSTRLQLSGLTISRPISVCLIPWF